MKKTDQSDLMMKKFYCIALFLLTAFSLSLPTLATGQSFTDPYIPEESAGSPPEPALRPELGAAVTFHHADTGAPINLPAPTISSMLISDLAPFDGVNIAISLVYKSDIGVFQVELDEATSLYHAYFTSFGRDTKVMLEGVTLEYARQVILSLHNLHVSPR